MKFELGANGIRYEFHSANGQMARELRKNIKDAKKLEAALEILAAVNRAAYDRGSLGTLRQLNKIEAPERRPLFRPPHLCPKHLALRNRGSL